MGKTATRLAVGDGRAEIEGADQMLNEQNEQSTSSDQQQARHTTNTETGCTALFTSLYSVAVGRVIASS